MKTVIAAALATGLVLSTFSASDAQAWGDREQGILVGIGSTILLDRIFNPRNRSMSYPQDVYGSRNGRFPPFHCSGSDVECAYERGVYERKRQEWQEMKQEAYICGRYPEQCE